MSGLVLSIDTSCDDTSAAVVCGHEIWSNVIASQTDLHRPYGGVFPTVAKQAHKENIEPTVNLALKRAGVTIDQISKIAVTIGPGLAPALEVGIEYAKHLAEQYDLALVPVNHIEGHLLSVLAQPKTKKSKQSKKTSDQSILLHQNSEHNFSQTANQFPRKSLQSDLGSGSLPQAQPSLTIKNPDDLWTSDPKSLQPSKPESYLLPALGLVVSGGNTIFVLIESPQVPEFYWVGGGLSFSPSDPPPNANSTATECDLASAFPDRHPRLGLDVSPLDLEQPWLNSGQFSYTIIGQTLDDAAGECLDKVGRMLNLGYPAGPVVEQLAKLGNSNRYSFPLPMTTTDDYNLSFAGLKTHARRMIEAKFGNQPPTKQQTYDFCASLQYAVFRHICYKLNKIIIDYPDIKEVWLGGGVAANMTLRKMVRQTLTQLTQQQSPKQTLAPQITKTNHVQLAASGKASKTTSNYKTTENYSLTRKLRTPYTKRLCQDNAGMGGVIVTSRSRKSLQHPERP